MTEDHEAPAAATDEEEVCPHCGSVLDVARAMEGERSILRARAGRAKPAAPEASDDPGVA